MLNKERDGIGKIRFVSNSLRLVIRIITMLKSKRSKSKAHASATLYCWYCWQILQYTLARALRHTGHYPHQLIQTKRIHYLL
jgi:hypothetical protein